MVPVVIAILVSAGFHAKRVAEQQTALRVVQTVITVQAPVEDSSAGPVNTHSVHCDITVKNVNLDTDMIVPAHNFLMWESLKDGPLRPVEDALETRISAGQSATFTVHFIVTDPTTIGSVTCGGPDVSPGEGVVWTTTFIQWGKLPAASSASAGDFSLSVGA